MQPLMFLPLISQVQDLRDKYDECHEMLLESQEAVKEVHRRSLPQGKVPSYSALNPLPVFPLVSSSPQGKVPALLNFHHMLSHNLAETYFHSSKMFYSFK